MSNRPVVSLDCVAQIYATPGERIIEVSHPLGGCLISIRPCTDGDGDRLRIEVSRAAPAVLVVGPVGQTIG